MSCKHTHTATCIPAHTFSRRPLPPYLCIEVTMPCTFDLPLMKALEWAEMSGKTVTIDICFLTSLASAVLNYNHNYTYTLTLSVCDPN